MTPRSPQAIYSPDSHRPKRRTHCWCLLSIFYLLNLVLLLNFVALDVAVAGEKSQTRYQVTNDTINKPLTSSLGDAVRGRHIFMDRERGNCLVCHAAPLPDRQMHGTVGPALDGIGSRYTAGALRLRLVDPQRINPQSIMPAYYKVSGLYRVLPPYRNKTLLTAQEIEDVLAFLLTLKKTSPPLEGQSTQQTAEAQAGAGSHNQKQSLSVVGTRRSGYTYLSQGNQQLQNDEFGNPGMLWVERGRELWTKTDGAAGKACASCHADEQSMRAVRARYPRFDSQSKKLVNIEQQINRCREQHMKASVYAYESESLLALTTFISFQSRNLPMEVQIDGPARPFFQTGRTFFMQRRGQLNLACAHCHDLHSGQRLHGEVISQGQINGFPIYRQLWQTLGSSHRMFAWCNTSIRAEPFALGSDDYVNLELYMAWRARGLSVESPAIRR